MSCPRCGTDDRQIELIFCKKCGKLIRKVCGVCGETISEKPCGCGGEEVPGESVG